MLELEHVGYQKIPSVYKEGSNNNYVLLKFP